MFPGARPSTVRPAALLAVAEAPVSGSSVNETFSLAAGRSVAPTARPRWPSGLLLRVCGVGCLRRNAHAHGGEGLEEMTEQGAGLGADRCAFHAAPIQRAGPESDSSQYVNHGVRSRMDASQVSEPAAASRTAAVTPPGRPRPECRARPPRVAGRSGRIGSAGAGPDLEHRWGRGSRRPRPLSFALLQRIAPTRGVGCLNHLAVRRRRLIAPQCLHRPPVVNGERTTSAASTDRSRCCTSTLPATWRDPAPARGWPDCACPRPLSQGRRPTRLRAGPTPTPGRRPGDRRLQVRQRPGSAASRHRPADHPLGRG